MTPPDSPRVRRSRKARRAAALARWSFRLAIVLLVFGLGVALGQALEEDPGPGGNRTSVRTLKPLPLPPARETVTVTVRTS